MEQIPLTKESLESLSNVLLNENSSFMVLRDTKHAYLQGLEAVSSVENLRFDRIQPLFLDTGKAITPFSAAHCVTDFIRTTAFIRGLHEAILAARQRFGKIPIHVCYVGTGPYATLMLPQTTRFSPEEVQFMLIEAHPVTLEMLKTVLAHFELDAYVKNIIFEDATQVELDPAEPIHIMITETMQAGLEKEPQVAITQHLTPQLADDAFFLPELVHIWAGMYSYLFGPVQRRSCLHSSLILQGYIDEYCNHPLHRSRSSLTIADAAPHFGSGIFFIHSSLSEQLV